MYSCLVHVGYHKTATTWLQLRLFRPEHGYAPLADHPEIFDTLVRPHSLVFDPAAFRALVRDRTAAAEEGLVPVVSSEILSGHPFYGGRESDVYADRLHAAVPDARILVSIRSQMRILPSVYMQYLFRGGRRTPEAFFSGEPEPGFFGFDPVHFEYDRLIARYQSLFGADRVHVLTQESLARDMDQAAARLAAFAGADRFTGLSTEARKVQSASYPEAAAGLLRRSNHLRRTVLNPEPVLPGNVGQLLYRGSGRIWRSAALGAAARRRRPLTDLVQNMFAERFSDSNRRLGDSLAQPVDLSDYP